jgi:hypothetical protein
LRDTGFAIVKDFTANVTIRYRDEYYGPEDMKIGVVVFGNGKLNTLTDGSTLLELAKNLLGLTSVIADVQPAIAGFIWYKGFTNMAQGLHLSDLMLGRGWREDATSVVLVISDGKFSLKYQTAEKARELKDTTAQIYLVAICESTGRDLEKYRKFFPEPNETYFFHDPGLDALACNAMMFSTKLSVTFCPAAISPSLVKAQAKMTIRKNDWAVFDPILLMTQCSDQPTLVRACVLKLADSAFHFCLPTPAARHHKPDPDILERNSLEEFMQAAVDEEDVEHGCASESLRRPKLWLRIGPSVCCPQRV